MSVCWSVGLSVCLSVGLSVCLSKKNLSELTIFFLLPIFGLKWPYFLENIVTTLIKYLQTNFNVIFPYFNKFPKLNKFYIKWQQKKFLNKKKTLFSFIMASPLPPPPPLNGLDIKIGTFFWRLP